MVAYWPKYSSWLLQCAATSKACLSRKGELPVPRFEAEFACAPRQQQPKRNFSPSMCNSYILPFSVLGFLNISPGNPALEPVSTAVQPLLCLIQYFSRDTVNTNCWKCEAQKKKKVVACQTRNQPFFRSFFLSPPLYAHTLLHPFLHTFTHTFTRSFTRTFKELARTKVEAARNLLLKRKQRLHHPLPAATFHFGKFA